MASVYLSGIHLSRSFWPRSVCRCHERIASCSWQAMRQCITRRWRGWHNQRQGTGVVKSRTTPVHLKRGCLDLVRFEAHQSGLPSSFRGALVATRGRNSPSWMRGDQLSKCDTTSTPFANQASRLVLNNPASISRSRNDARHSAYTCCCQVRHQLSRRGP